MTFNWAEGHNVNYIGKGKSAGQQWKDCRPVSNTTPGNGPYSLKLTTTGSHYFFCGVENGLHCFDGHMQANITVVNDVIHSGAMCL